MNPSDLNAALPTDLPVDSLSRETVLAALGPDASRFSLEFFPEIDSTSTYLKQKVAKAPASLPSWHAVIAASQTAGRGRLGRSFHSPAGSGLYCSVLLRPPVPAARAVRVTAAAAVAACRAVEACTPQSPQIKWVNDLFLRGRKTCGILTESALDPRSGLLDWVVVGIGFNVYQPEGGFPPDLQKIAGALASARLPNLRARLAAAFLREFRILCDALESPALVEEYRRRSFLPGRRILVLSGGSAVPARALEVDDECRLRVRYDDGSTVTLSSGEVSVRPADAEKEAAL